MDEWAVADGWWGTDGAWHVVSPDTRAALRRAQGSDDHPVGPPESTPMWFVREGTSPELWSPCTVRLESPGVEAAGDRRAERAVPADLPLGCHTLVPDDGGEATQLFVVPQRAPRPARGWAWSTQLYATRSSESWGQGDLGDLATLADWSARTGAELLAHNPIGASIPLSHQQPSPYYASSRRFWSPLYLRVEAIDGAELVGNLSEVAAAGRALNTSRSIDRDEIWRLKSAALDSIWAVVRRSDATRSTLAAVAGDPALTAHATYSALAEHHRTGWLEWPAEHRHPDSPGVAAFAEASSDRVDFWRWAQIETDSQLARAASAGSGLMADLPVGFDPGGADAWCDQDLLALDCSVGAPPDDLGPLGQDWGLPPYVPWKLRSAGYRPWIDTLRRLFRHCAALRIDHVMGLFRLFWIPAGGDARHGGYVYQGRPEHRTELLDLAVMEAARAGASVVGEDLGTVEAEVREAMSERDVFGYRIGWFAHEPPDSWPSNTLAALTTHDLPTVAGLWSGADAESRNAAGLEPDPEEDLLLRNRLLGLAGIDPDADEAAAATAREVSVRAHRALAASASDLAVVTLEDAVGVVERPNLPGTVDEHPNWRIALPVPLEELDDAGAGELAEIMRAERPVA